MCYYKREKRVIKMSSKHIVDFCGTKANEEYGKMNLVQIGRLVCEPGYRIKPHTHLNWFEITCVIEGEGSIYGAEKKVAVKKGDIFLSFPCETHAISSSKDNPLSFDHFAFFTEDRDYKDALERLMANYADASKRVFRNFRIRETLDSSVNELLEASDYQKDFLTASFSLILLEILKQFDVKRSGNYIGDEIQQSPEKLCETIKHYIDTHLFSLGSLSELSDKCGYNYSYLSFLFKKVTGITLSDYYKHKRFESARLMVQENKLKISEISNLLGYNSVYAFSKAFKDEFGMSPKNFYKENKN